MESDSSLSTTGPVFGTNRKRPALLAGVILLAALAAPPLAHSNTLFLADCNFGFHGNVYFSNEVVCVSGTADTIIDGLFPSADVYVTENRSWNGGEDLSGLDVTGILGISSPNRVGGAPFGAGAFFDEIIWLPVLAPGEYDIVMDEDGDGIYNEPNSILKDRVLGFGGSFAFRVVPAPLGAFVPNVTQIKLEAAKEAVKWQLAKLQFKLIGYLKTLLDAAGHLTNPSRRVGRALATVTLVAGAKGEPTDYNDAVLSIGGEIVGRLADEMSLKHLNLALDPPDPDFENMVSLDISGLDTELSDIFAAAGFSSSYPFQPMGVTPLEGATMELAALLVEQAAIIDALIRSNEKYLGATDVNNHTWAVIHANGLIRYADLLADNAQAVGDAALAVKTEMLALPLGSHVVDVSVVAELQARVAASGLTSEEIRGFKDLGWSDEDITDLVDQILATEIPSQDFSPTSVMDEIVDFSADLLAEAQALSTSAQDVRDDLEFFIGPMFEPSADTGGPYAGTAGLPIDLDGSASTPNDTALTFEWDLDLDGQFDDDVGAVPSALFDTAGSRLTGLMVTNNFGFQDIAYARVDVVLGNLPPVITAFSPTDVEQQLLIGDPLSFSVTATDPEGDPLSFSWTQDGVEVSTGTSFTFTPTAGDAGGNLIRIRVSDTDPVSPDALEQRLVAVLFPDGDSDGFRSDDDCNDGDEDINPDQPEIVGDGIDNDCDPSTIDAGQGPSAAFFNVPPQGVVNEPIQFNDVSTDPNADIVTFLWDFGDSGSSSVQNPSHTYTGGGTFDVTLTVTDAQSNFDSITQQVVVLEPPTAAFSTSPVPAIVNEPVQFTELSTVPVGTIVSWDWDFDDGATSNLQNPAHTFTDDGIFDVTLTATDNNGLSRSTTQPVLVAVRPTADFSASLNNVIGVDVVFTDLSTDDGLLTDWFWQFGDGATSTEQNPTHAYASAGTFDVTLTATDDDGATDTITMQVAVGVGDPPVAGFSLFPLFPVANESVQFTDESSDPDNQIVSYLYEFGDGSSSTEPNPAHTYLSPGNVDATLTVTDEAGNEGVLTIVGIPVRARPVADFSSPASTSVGVPNAFDNLSTDEDGTIVAYAWDFGDGNTSTEESPTHPYGVAGNFTVSLTVTDSHGLTASTSQPIQVLAGGAPVADFSFAPIDPSVGVDVGFTDLSTDDGGIAGWDWDFGDGGSSTEQNPTHAFSTLDTFTVTLTVTDTDGLANAISQDVTVGAGAAPVAAFTPAAPFVEGDVTQFNDESTDPDNRIVSWLWSFGDGGSSTEQNPGHMYTARGLVDVSLTVTDEAGNPDTLTITSIPVIGKPVAGFVFAPTEPSTVDVVQFTDTSTAPDGTIVSWSWDFDDGTTSDLQNPTHTFSTGGTFNVFLTVTDSNGLTGTTVQAIEVTGLQRPVAAFDYDPKDAASGEIVGFSDQSTDDGTIVGWDWDFGDGGNSTDQNPNHSYAEGGTYTVSLTVTDDDGLTDTTSQEVTIRGRPVARFAPGKGMNVASLEDGASIVDFSDANLPTFPPENAIDFNPGSSWSSPVPTDQFIAVRLTGGGPHVIDRVVLRGSNNTNSMRNFEVLVSNTGTDEEDFVSVVTGTVPRTNPILLHEFTFPGIQARFVKLFVIDNHGSTNQVVVTKFEVWSRDRQGGIVSLRDGPRPTIVDVSSVFPSIIDQWIPEHLLDDDALTNSSWSTASGQNTNQWVKIQLGGGLLYTIDRVRLRSAGSSEVRDFEVRVSNTTADDAAFTTVLTGTAEFNKDLQEFSFAPVEARFVEFFVVDTHRGSTVQVETFQVWTEDGANATRAAGVGAFIVDFSSRFSIAVSTAPENIIDNNPSTRWDTGSGQVTDQYATVLLVTGVPWRINKILIEGAAGTLSPMDFDIRVSTTGLDPADFTTVYTDTLPSDGLSHWFMFPPVSAKYVQLFLKNNHGSTSTIRTETFQVYSTQLGESTVPFENFSFDVDGEIVSYFWDFGDGNTSTEAIPEHTYAAPGIYTVTLTVTDDEGLTNTYTDQYTVLQVPAVDFTVSTAFPEEEVQLTLTGLDNNETTSIVDWEWTSSLPNIFNDTRVTNARFVDSGPVEVTLTVTDNLFIKNSVTKILNVLNRPPTANAGNDLTTVWGKAEPVGGNPGDPSNIDLATLTCDWDFGDGQGLQVTDCNSSGDFFGITHTYDLPGTYIATLTVTDKDGDWTSDSKIVTVNKRDTNTTIYGELDIPEGGGQVTANARLIDFFEDNRGTRLEGETISFSLGGQTIDVVTDADGLASATFNVPAGEPGPVWANFFENTFYNGSRDRPFLDGDVFLAIGQGFARRYTQDGEFINLFDTTSGSSETAGMCFDGQDNLYVTSFQTGQVTKFDRTTGETIHPWAQGFSSRVESCVYDSDSDVIYTGEVDGNNFIRKFDTDGNLLDTYDTRTTARGTDWMDLASDRCSMFYTSEDNEIMVYDVCTDEQGEDFFPEDTVPGLNRPCFALRIRPNGEVMTACRQEVVRLDPDGNIVQRYSRTSFGGGGTTPNALFALNLDPDGTSFWTVGFNSGHAFKADIATGTVITSFPIERSGPTAAGLAIFGEPTAATDNKAPVADDQDVALDENTFIDITLTATDPELDDLTFEIVDPPLNGDLTGTPPDVTYTPDLDFFGSDDFTFRANDGELDSNIATVSIEVGLVNGPPVADAGGPYIGVEGVTLTLNASASTDPDLPTGDTISFAWDLDEDGLFDDGAGVMVDATYEDIASLTVSVMVTDSFGEVDVADALVLVNNDPPIVDAGPDRNILEGETVDLPPATWSDAGELDTHTATTDWGDGSPVEECEVTEGNVPLTLLSDTGALLQLNGVGTVSCSHVYPNEGVFTAEVCVTDDDGGTGCDSFQVTVGSLNNPPDLAPINDIELPEGTALDVLVSAIDPDQDPISLVDAGLPDFASFTDNGDGTGTISLAPDFDDADVYPDASITASDGSADDTEFFTITVTEVNRAPVADAGPDQNVQTNAEVQLDGSGSSDPDQDLISFSWSFDQVPQGSTLTDQDLSDPASAMPTFTPDVDGSYTLSLVVMDAELASDPDTVVISSSTPNVPPNADAGPDQNQVVGDTVNLDGTGSNDPDDSPEPLSFLWTFVSVPAGSNLDDGSISDATEAEASFVPDAAGTYVVDLEVSDGEDSDNDQVNIFVTIANVPPNADAGDDLTDIILGEDALPDGTGSNDPDDGPEPLTFAWRFVSVPAASALTNADILGSDSDQPSFTPDVAGTYVLELEVFDGEDSDVDSMTVIVVPPNVPPIADAGDNQEITLGETAFLDGTGSTDPDQGPDPLSFSWGFVSVPPGSGLTDADIAGAETDSPSFTPDVEGAYTLDLEVFDGEDSGFDEVIVSTLQVPNIPPLADAGGDQELLLGETADLDGSGSSDPDEGPEPLSFSWRFLSTPAGSALTDADIVGADSVQPSFTPDVLGDYILELQVFDGEDPGTDQVMVTALAVPNEPPVADAGPDQNVETGEQVDLNGSDSFDPDGDLITYAWSFEQTPAGSTLTDQDLIDPTSPMPMFTPDVDGLYRLRLVVMDAEFESEPDFVDILASTPNVPPNADAGPDQNKFVGEKVILDGTGSDDPDDGPEPLSFSWTFVSVPGASGLDDGSISTATEAVASFIPDVPGTYEMNLEVSDGEDADSDQANVFVTVQNVPPNADAGGDLIIDLGDPALPDGSGSDDPDNGPDPLEFAWRFVSVPAGSALMNDDIVDGDTATPTFVPDVDGTYVLELEVFDGEDNDFDNMSVTVELPPEPSVCDLDESGDVDLLDIDIILGFRNQPADQCEECDIDGDGFITVLDARRCVVECTRPRCVND